MSPPGPDFWSKVDRAGGPDACWPWTGYRNPKGYGQTTLEGRTMNASRAAYIRTYGPLADGRVVCHRCDNPPCCNPAHLFEGTAAVNTADMFAKGRNGARTRPDRLARGDRNGARLHPDRMPRGERHGQTHLTAAQVRAIRDGLSGGRPVKDLARSFAVDPKTIRNIRDRRVWGHV